MEIFEKFDNIPDDYVPNNLNYYIEKKPEKVYSIEVYNLKDSLTEVGQKFIEGNFFESLIIWEHQKLKMISQPPVIDISNVYRYDSFKEEQFSINYNHSKCDPD